MSPAGGGGESATRDRAVAAEDAPDPTADELVARAAAMRDTLRGRQAECEALGRLPDATNDEYIEAGFFRVLQPQRFGGYELGLEAFLRIAIELSRGCASSGWVYALTAGHAHTVTMWPEQGQVELFGDGDFRCPFSNLPARALAVDGGFRVDGWWDYGSGCDTATHFIGGTGVVDAPDGEIVDTRWAAFPRDAYRIVDNWDTLGMRGTGSRRVVVEDLLVPEHHTVPSPNPGRPVVDFPGRGVHANAIYRGESIIPLLVSEPAAVAVGIAQGDRPLRRGRPDAGRCDLDAAGPRRRRARDMIRTHVTMQFERTWQNVGQMRLGLPPGSFF